MVSGCGGRRSSDAPVQVYDGGKILLGHAGLLELLTNRGRTLDARFIIVTASEVNPRSLSIQADRASGKLSEGQFWAWRLLFPRSGRSITYFYSQKPQLLQIRYGRYFRHLARLAGIDYGPKYKELQELRLEDGTPDFVRISEQIAARLKESDFPFYLSWTIWVATLLDDELLPLIAVPTFELWDGMSSLIAVHMYNFLGTRLPNYFVFTATLVFLILLVFSFMVPIWARFGTPVQTSEGLHYHANSLPGCLVYLASFAFLLVAVFPMFGFLVLSAGQRTEDLITTHALGIDVGFNVPHQLDWSIVLLLAIVTIAARLPATIADIAKEDDPAAVLGLLKLLVVVPVAYCLLPGWAVVISACLASFGALFGIAFVLFSRRHATAHDGEQE
jgi:hypothetical protein